MSTVFREIDGIRCYAPEVARSHADYPAEGFDVTAQIEARSFWCRARNRLLRNIFERFTDRTRPLDVLEIGCGTGFVLKALSAVSNLRLTGSEIYLQGLHYARETVPDVTFIQLDATKMPFRSEFDVIGAFDVLEHIADDRGVIDQVKLALRPGGMFVITVPQYQWMWSRLDEVVEHKRRYTRADLLGKLQDAGFTIRYITSFVTLLFPVMVMSRLLSKSASRPDDARGEFAAKVTIPAPLNWAFDKVMRVEEALLRTGVRLPFGGSLLIVGIRQ
jgi:SAM-dependent methyltransferase